MTLKELILSLDYLKNHNNILVEEGDQLNSRVMRVPESFIRGEGKIKSKEELSVVIIPFSAVLALSRVILLDGEVADILEDEFKKKPELAGQIEQVISWSALLTGFFPISNDLGNLKEGSLKNCYVIRGGYLHNAALKDSSLFVSVAIAWLHWILRGSMISVDGRLIFGEGSLFSDSSSMEYPLNVNERHLPYAVVLYLTERLKAEKTNAPFMFNGENDSIEKLGLELTRTVALLLRDDSVARRSLNPRELAKLMFYKVYLFWVRRKVLSSEFYMDLDPNQHSLDFDGANLDPMNYVLGGSSTESTYVKRDSARRVFNIIKSNTKLDVIKKGSLPPLGVVRIKVHKDSNLSDQDEVSIELGDLLYESNFANKLKKPINENEDFIVLDFRSLCFGQTSSRSIEKAHSFAALGILLAVSGSDKFSGLYGLSKHLIDTLIESGVTVSMDFDGRRFTKVEIDHRLALGTQSVFIKGYSPTKGEVGLDEWMMDAQSITAPSILKLDESYIGGNLKPIKAFISKNNNNIQAKLALHLVSPGRYEGTNYTL